MKLTDNELNELKYHYVDRVVDNMSTKDLVQYVFDDMLRYVDLLLNNENNILTDFLHNHLDKLNDEQWLEVYKDYNRSFN